MQRVDVVVVSFNSQVRLREGVRALAGIDGVAVFVADNASTDDSLEVIRDLRGVTAIQLPRNGGFGYGCNAGWRAGTSPFVLFLNPDARIEPAALSRLTAVLEAEPQAGAVAPRILEDDGSLDFSLNRFPRLRSTFARALFLHRVFPRASWADEVVREERAYSRRGPVEWVSGACVLVRREALERIGGFDEDFFLYSEDIDLCRRLSDCGYEVRFEPDALAVHVGGASAPRASLLPMLAESRLRYARKHRSTAAALGERAGVALGALTHTIVSGGGRAARIGHARALRLALTGLPRR